MLLSIDRMCLLCYCFNRMNLIEKLWECQRQKQDASPIIAGFGITSWKTLAMPLSQLSEKESMALVINWVLVTRKRREKWIMQFRLRDETNNKVNAVWIKKNMPWKIKVVKIKYRENASKLYDWLPDTMYKNLTRVEIANSIRRVVNM